MGWTKHNLVTQFERGEKAGWVPLIEAAATTYGFTPSVLWALGSRETNLDPKYLKVTEMNKYGYNFL